MEKTAFVQTFIKGEILSGAIGHSEGVYFDLDDAGATLRVYFNEPQPHEVEQFESGNRFEIRFAHLYNVIMVLVKIGDLNWMDAPYSPHLSVNLTAFKSPKNENEGLALTLVLINASNGRIEHVRFIGLSNRFAKDLARQVAIESNNGFDKAQYDEFVDRIFARYSTKDLVDLSSSYCRL